MGKWLNELLVKFILTGKFKVFINERLPLKTNPAKDGIFDFPIFHHSIIPSHEAEVQISKNYQFFNRLYNFRDVYLLTSLQKFDFHLNICPCPSMNMNH